MVVDRGRSSTGSQFQHHANGVAFSNKILLGQSQITEDSRVALVEGDVNFVKRGELGNRSTKKSRIIRKTCILKTITPSTVVEIAL